MSCEVILYRYDSSPFSHKIDYVLLLKNVPHKIVNVAPTLPRAEITGSLGITYRRIPILAIGNDVYCDTSLIAPALENRFPPSQGYGTLFPPRKNGGGADTGLIKAFAKHYMDTAVFPLAVALLPWDKIPKPFIEDRSKLSGAPINVDAIVASRGRSTGLLTSHLTLIEEQLVDGREWLFDTTLPGFGDISVYFVFAWIKSLPGGSKLFDSHRLPLVVQWLSRAAAHFGKLKAQQGKPGKLSGDIAAKIIASSTFEPYSVVGFDLTEASRLGLQTPGVTVSIAPDDTGRTYPTTGQLVALSSTEYVIEIMGSAGLIRCHFPRIGFSLLPESRLKNKL